ncbi:MAG: hypothetical protein M1274_07005 [Actinobacteria bacterium]|nr:hypothetical protein [Actinomycetota bacterium]
MAFSEDVFPPDECCEICGIQLDDEVVIQEFADGSLARLCPECASGAVFDTEPQPPAQSPRSGIARVTPQDQATPSASGPASGDPSEIDALEITRELLVPVTDLIGLQTDMQAALERLAASLERFAADVISESKDKSASVESRLKTLENELEKTRVRLNEAESLLVTGNGTAYVADMPAGAGTPVHAGTPATAAPAGATPAVPVKPAAPAATSAAAAAAAATPAPTPSAESAPPAAASASTPVAPPAPAPSEEAHAGFRLDEIQLAQRFFNESPFTERIKDVRRSLGKPKANLSRIQGVEPRALVTVTWDIVWYQYLVSLRKDAPADHRVALFREGMDLDELAEHFREKNASVDDDGRLDASELEVRLLSDPTVLITEMSPDEERALEDATEEIWDQQISQEFKWDA